MKKKLRKINVKKVGLILISCLIILFGILGLIKINNNNLLKNKIMFMAGNNSTIKLYDAEFKKIDNIIRGSEVEVLKDHVVDNESKKIYSKIKFNKKVYLVLSNVLVENLDDVVLEEKLYVRTPITIYKDSDGSSILSMAKKGTEVEILGFDKIDENGIVNRYKIQTSDNVGYVYSKYLVATKEESLKNYDEEGNYLIHKSRGDTQGGGSAANLDYYPYKKFKFKDNTMPEKVQALYLNNRVLGNVDEYIKLAKKTNINAFVVDVKDNTSPGYPSDAMKIWSPTNYKYANNSFEKYQKVIKKLKDSGFYVIGRITVFKDSYYIKDHPEDAILDKVTGKPYDHNNSYWPTAFSRNVWEFNVELAKDAVRQMGFNEIQFDYVRFPDRTYKLEKNGVIDMHNIYKEEKAQAIQQFVMYACDEIHQLDAYVSIDVFGESAHNYVTGYGQYWGAISNVADVISGMPYPDHFNVYQYDFDKIVWTVPYDLLNFWGSNYVMKHQNEIPTPAVVRTWIQAYNAIRSPHIKYDASKISDEISGLYDAGLTGGFMTWNASSSLSKYSSLVPAFQKEY